MDWGFLAFLAEPWFVIPWYLVGAVGAAWVFYDTKTANKSVKPAIRRTR